MAKFNVEYKSVVVQNDTTTTTQSKRCVDAIGLAEILAWARDNEGLQFLTIRSVPEKTPAPIKTNPVKPVVK
jgi:hypothetical protein